VSLQKGLSYVPVNINIRHGPKSPIVYKHGFLQFSIFYSIPNISMMLWETELANRHETPPSLLWSTRATYVHHSEKNYFSRTMTISLPYIYSLWWLVRLITADNSLVAKMHIYWLSSVVWSFPSCMPRSVACEKRKRSLNSFPTCWYSNLSYSTMKRNQLVYIMAHQVTFADDVCAFSANRGYVLNSPMGGIAFIH